MKNKKINTKLSVYDLNGKAVDTIQLDEEVFDGFVNKVLLYEVNKMYEANMRRGTASTKTQGEVAGGGKKPWRQKGTGRARVGSIRSPLWRHGGVVFGPKPRDFSYYMPKKAVKMALVSSLNARLLEEAIKPIVKIELEKPKTKVFKAILDKLKVNGKTLVAVNELDEKVEKSSRNIKDISVKRATNISARDVLLNENLVIEKEALEKLIERLR